MSSSEQDRASRLGTVAATLRAAAQEGNISDDALREVMSAATLLYAKAVAAHGHEVSLRDRSVDATASVVLACALLRAQDLNPFDLALWFGRVVPDTQHM